VTAALFILGGLALIVVLLWFEYQAGRRAALEKAGGVAPRRKLDTEVVALVIFVGLVGWMSWMLRSSDSAPVQAKTGCDASIYTSPTGALHGQQEACKEAQHAFGN
jgi:hypothetical protein